MNTFPVYSVADMVKDKCMVSEMTSNSNRDCDQMFIPEFLATLDYAVTRFNQMYIPPTKQ